MDMYSQPECSLSAAMFVWQNIHDMYTYTVAIVCTSEPNKALLGFQNTVESGLGFEDGASLYSIMH